MVKKSLKTLKPTTDDGLLSKTRTTADFIGDDSVLNNPACDKWRTRLINTILHFADQPTSIEMEQFCSEYKIHRARLFYWSKSYPDVKKAVNMARLMLASRRRVGCMTKKLDTYTSYRDIHLLDPKEIKVNAYHDDRKKKIEDAKTGPIVFVNGSNLPKPREIPRENNE